MARPTFPHPDPLADPAVQAQVRYRLRDMASLDLWDMDPPSRTAMLPEVEKARRWLQNRAIVEATDGDTRMGRRLAFACFLVDNGRLSNG